MSTPERLFTFGRSTFAESLPMVLTHHYTQRRCADPVAVFAVRQPDNFEPVACAIFAAPANKYFGASAAELVRLVRTPAYDEPISAFIAYCLAELKKEKRFSYCLAYADTGAGHHGGIYQACSFAYIGLSKGHTMYRDHQGTVTSARSRDQSTVATQTKLTAFRSSPKHLYVKGLSATTAHILGRLGRESLPYPKPQTPRQHHVAREQMLWQRRMFV